MSVFTIMKHQMIGAALAAAIIDIYDVEGANLSNYATLVATTAVVMLFADWVRGAE